VARVGRRRGIADWGWLYPGNFFAARCDVFARMPWKDRPVENRYWLEQLPGYLFHRRYLGNVSNAIFGDTAKVDARDSGVGDDAFDGAMSQEDAFWARFDAALGGRRHFEAETRIR